MLSIFEAFIYTSFLALPQPEPTDLTVTYDIRFDSDLTSLIGHPSVPEQNSLIPEDTSFRFS